MEHNSKDENPNNHTGSAGNSNNNSHIENDSINTNPNIEGNAVSRKGKLMSYNDTIKDYDLHLLTPNKITVNHLLTISPIFADISDAFGHIILHPETALSCQIFLYKSTKDNLPTLDISRAQLNSNMDPILFPMVYSSSTYGTKDLPIIFSYALTQCVRYFKENSWIDY